jgi:hypothetical protein
MRVINWRAIYLSFKVAMVTGCSNARPLNASRDDSEVNHVLPLGEWHPGHDKESW